jgi:hypothetical protein
MAATPTAAPRFFARHPSTDLPLVGGKVYTYLAGTSTLEALWADKDKSANVANPFVLEADGGKTVFLDGSYKFIVRDSNDVLLYEVDGILGGSSAFDKPASGITSLAFDDISSTNVQDALEEIANSRFKKTDEQGIVALIAEWLVPVGATIEVNGRTVPDGYLEENGQAVSRTTYPELFDYLVTQEGFSGQTFTVTIASPAVFTKTSHGFVGGERIRLSTTGALPTGLDTSTDYYVLSANIAANTFRVSATWEGTAINTSGTQSGTHTYTQSLHGLGNGTTTFNVPDSRGIATIGWAHGRSVDVGGQVGAELPETIGTHAHTASADTHAGHTHQIPIADDFGEFDDVAVPNTDRTTILGYVLTLSGGSHTHVITVNNNSGTRNVPRRASKMRCIRAY